MRIPGMKWFGGDRGEKILRTGDEIPVMLQVIPLGEEIEPDEDYSIYDNQAKAFNQFVWVYAAVNRIAEAAAMIPFNVYERKGEDFIPIYDHPFEQLMDDPSPHMSRFELIEQTIIHLELQGNGYWYTLLDSDGQPIQIEVLRPQELIPHPHSKKFIDYYTLEINNRKKNIPAESITHFKRYHPRKKYVGLSAIEAASKTLTLEDRIYRYNNSFFGNNARPSGILTTDSVVPPELQKRIEQAWGRRFKGEEQAHKTALLMGGVKFQAIGLAPKDAEFISLMGLNRDEILAIFGVSTANLGIVKDVNKSNAEAMYYMFIRDTIKPKLTRIEQKITSGIIKRYYGDQFVGKFEEVTAETKEQILDEMKIVGKYGVVTVNEFRQRYLKMKPVKDPAGNVLIAHISKKDLEDFFGEIHEYDYKNTEE